MTAPAPLRFGALVFALGLASCTGRGVVAPGTDGASDVATDITSDRPADAQLPTSDTGIDADRRTDEEINATCIACHAPIGDRWRMLSSHHLLFNCTVCHTQQLARPGPGHQDRPSCSHCHSEGAHPDDGTCRQCHDPHGSTNAFLLNETLTLPGDAGTATVHVTRPEGATSEGFVRAGVPDAGAGTGFCEVCHTTTAYYTRAGTGSSHNDGLCSGCHSHPDGFRPTNAR